MYYFKALFTGERLIDSDSSHTKVYFQVFDRRQIINNERTFIKVITQPSNRLSISDRPGFSLNNKIHAILDNDKLVFKSFYMVRRFLDMDGYFSEATNDDLISFIKNPIFDIENQESFLESADSSIRKKVSLISNSGILNTDAVKLKECAELICIPIDIINSNGVAKIVMPSEKKEIKKLLNFLDQGYFNTLITNETMFTNSKRYPKL